MAVTMRDVAQQAGVSIKTVSRVVNDQGEISEATRERVVTVIQELGYRPSKLAQALVTRKTHTIGLVMGDITYNPFFSEVARGVLDTARAKDYNVFLCNVDETQEHELDVLHSLADHAVDGIIVYPTYFSEEGLKTFANFFRPIVAINKFFEHPGIGAVLLETSKGASLAVDYLAGKGYTKIGMIVLGTTSTHLVQRLQGFRAGIAANQLEIVEDWIITTSKPTYEAGYKAMQSLLLHSEVEAVFAYNDLLAMGAIQACRDAGVRVPEDFAIVGFDDIDWAEKNTPPLTTIRIDKYGVGRMATEYLFSMLDDDGDDIPTPIYVDVELVVRESA